MAKKNPNPTGKGGFKDHPELINKKGNVSRSEEFRQLFKKHMSEEELLKCLEELCAKGDKHAITYTVDRFFGKTKETIEHELPEEIHITIKGDRGD